MPKPTGVYRDRTGAECHVCEQPTNDGGVGVDTDDASVVLCPDCAKLAGKIGEEIEPSGGGV